MTIQFKKFILGFASLAFGIIIFSILGLINDPNKAGLGAPAVVMFYMMLSVVSAFLFHPLVKRRLWSVKKIMEESVINFGHSHELTKKKLVYFIWMELDDWTFYFRTFPAT